MIIGVGTDILEIDRIKAMKDSIRDRIFTAEERRQANGKISMLAGDFACKEAVAKTFGTGFRDFRPEDIEILRDSLGKPYAKLYRGALKQFQDLNGTALHLSISDTSALVIGFAVLENTSREGASNGDHIVLP